MARTLGGIHVGASFPGAEEPCGVWWSMIHGWKWVSRLLQMPESYKK